MQGLLIICCVVVLFASPVIASLLMKKKKEKLKGRDLLNWFLLTLAIALAAILLGWVVITTMDFKDDY